MPEFKFKIIIAIFLLSVLTGSITAFFLFSKSQNKGAANTSNTIFFDDGSQYTGEIKDEKANGQGEISFKSGDKYEGQFLDNLFDGQGTYSWPNGDKYIGEFKKGKFHGKGKYIHADGTVEEGNWINDVLIE